MIDPERNTLRQFLTEFKSSLEELSTLVTVI
jgi:hypothetical protein